MSFYPFLFYLRPALKFIAWTKTDLQAKDDMQNVIPPHVGIEVSRTFIDLLQYLYTAYCRSVCKRQLFIWNHMGNSKGRLVFMIMSDIFARSHFSLL